MTFRSKGLDYLKFSITLFLLFVFVLVIVYADKFQKGPDTLYVNTVAFAQTNSDEQHLINLEYVTAEIGEDNKGVINYIVQPGDTLSKIASTFGTTVSHIKKTNNINGPIQPNQKLIITDESEGLIYTIDGTQNILVFANRYGLNVEDLMSLNYIQDETEMLQDGQEIFVPITLEKAYDIGMMERPKPVYKPKTTVTYKPTITKPTVSSYVVSSRTPSVASIGDYSSSSILSSWVFNKNINNKFYAGHCTWYIAAITPQIFPYLDDTSQARPFGGNANQWYANAKSAGFSVGSKPVAGSIVVYRRGGGGYAGAGHVAKVVSYNAGAGTMVVEEMNGSKKFVVQRRTDRVDNPNIIGYIYMPATPWVPN
ncbi:MAG TPA: LysM peptidoglycan-binding domain-containing protein [Candidatus Absconditabacterales bacterium]|nr:LysM peptidoglycan-binding domain-containing protein [Candidatus Absconditabacterales bacterium]HPK28262.1 LysM peptidoglycan-binding domain-containing protein [Candidatus Absconditabacterales bacterium]